MAKNLIPSGRNGQYAPLVLAAVALVFSALHHGSYPVADRQLTAIVIWLAIGVFAAFGGLPRVVSGPAAWIAIGLLAAAGVWAAIGLAWTESAEQTTAEVARYAGYAGLLVLIAVTVGRRNWRMVAAGLLLAGVAVCAAAVLSRCWPSVFPSDDIALRLHTWRLGYPLGYWNAVGAWAAMTIAACVGYAAHARSEITRAAALAAVPLCAAVLYLTLSRGALAGAVFGCAVVVALARNRWLTALQAAFAACASLAVIGVLRRQDQILHATGGGGAGSLLAALAVAGLACALVAVAAARLELGARLRMRPRAARSAFIAGAAVALALAVWLVAQYGGKALDEFNTTNFTAPTTSDSRLLQLNGNRVNLWRSALRAFEAEPVTGIGAGTFGYWWNRDGANDDKVRDAHNIYLEALAEAGLPGLLLLLAFFAALAFAAWRARERLRTADDVGAHAALCGVFAVFVLQAGTDWLWELTAVAAMALTAIAVAAASSSPSAQTVQAPRRRALICAVAVAAVFLQLPGLVSEQYVQQSRAAFRSGQIGGAINDASRAIRTEPWSASAYAQRALVNEAAGDLAAAQRDIAAAQRREPTNWLWPLIDVRILAKAGRRAAAQAQLRRAKHLRPHSAVFQGR